MTTLPLFAYGTLQDADILSAVLGRTLPPSASASAHLPAFKCLYYPGQVYPALVPHPESHAIGKIITGLTSTDWAALDAFEGEEYRRECLLVVSSGRSEKAFVYLPACAISADGRPWSLDHWQRHHKPTILEAERALARQARTELP